MSSSNATKENTQPQLLPHETSVAAAGGEKNRGKKRKNKWSLNPSQRQKSKESLKSKYPPIDPNRKEKLYQWLDEQRVARGVEPRYVKLAAQEGVDEDNDSEGETARRDVVLDETAGNVDAVDETAGNVDALDASALMRINSEGGDVVGDEAMAQEPVVGASALVGQLGGAVDELPLNNEDGEELAGSGAALNEARAEESGEETEANNDVVNTAWENGVFRIHGPVRVDRDKMQQSVFGPINNRLRNGKPRKGWREKVHQGRGEKQRIRGRTVLPPDDIIRSISSMTFHMNLDE